MSSARSVCKIEARTYPNFCEYRYVDELKVTSSSGERPRGLLGVASWISGTVAGMSSRIKAAVVEGIFAPPVVMIVL